ncbi:MAG: hypothetical protein WC367_04940 [Methanoregula sp.]|jgi:hypothetical protein
MPLTFCFKVTRNIAKYGYAKMAARRLANACIILMAFACGLMGIDVNEKEPLCPIAGAGVVFTGAPAGNVSPVFSAIRR